MKSDDAGRESRRRLPEAEGLEDRCLLSAAQTQATRVAWAWHKYHEYVSELQRIELKSEATPAASQALTDAARTIGADAAATPGASAQARAVAVSVQLDQAPLYGSLGDSGWAAVRDRLEKNLSGLQVPPAAIDQAIAAMKAVAQSANVTSSDYETLTAKEEAYQDARSSVRNTTAHLPDPGTYYTQHLRGFFRGGAALHSQDKATLRGDLSSIAGEASDTPAQQDVLRRDAQLLQQIGATLTRQADAQFTQAFVASFESGAPSVAGQAALLDESQGIVGTNASQGTRHAVERLVGDVDELFPAAGSSPKSIQTIATDVEGLVANGGAGVNLFKVSIARGARAGRSSG